MSGTETGGEKPPLEMAAISRPSNNEPITSASSGAPNPPDEQTVEGLAGKIRQLEELTKNAKAEVEVIHKIAIGGKWGLTVVAIGIVGTFLGFFIDAWNDYDKYIKIQEENIELEKRINELQDELEQVETLTDQLKVLTEENSIESKFQRINDRLSNIENFQ